MRKALGFSECFPAAVPVLVAWTIMSENNEKGQRVILRMLPICHKLAPLE